MSDEILLKNLRNLFIIVRLNARFSNYFVQISIIRSKCQKGQRWSRGRKKFQGVAAPPAFILSAPMDKTEVLICN